MKVSLRVMEEPLVLTTTFGDGLTVNVPDELWCEFTVAQAKYRALHERVLEHYTNEYFRSDRELDSLRRALGLGPTSSLDEIERRVKALKAQVALEG